MGANNLIQSIDMQLCAMSPQNLSRRRKKSAEVMIRREQ
jgi:hypothetical protein